MDDICQRIREEIPELIDAGLSPEKAVELEQHRSLCPKCNEYFVALEADDKLLCEFSQKMQPNVARLGRVVMDELRRRRLGVGPRMRSSERRILNSSAMLIAAAILITAMILIGAVILRSPGEKPGEVAIQSDKTGMDQPEPPKPDGPDLEAIARAELQEIQRMIASSDVDGVVAMLDNGQPQSKIAAANYLATTGNESLIGILSQLAAEWQGEATENPFAAAITQIMTRLQESQNSETKDDTTVAETTAVDGEQNIERKGVVVDEQGQPIGNARVMVYHNRGRKYPGNRVMEETTSATDGSFVCRRRIEFSDSRELFDIQQPDTMMAVSSEYVIVATHSDYAFGWQNITQGSEQNTYRIVLTNPISRGIVVTDRNGNPLTGVRIWLHTAGDSKSSRAIFRDELILACDVGFGNGITDSMGRAIINNLPNTNLSFRATLKGYVEAVVVPGQRINRVSLNQGVVVSGWVLADGSAPVVDAIVGLKPEWMSTNFQTVTDRNGHFHLEGLPAKGWESRGNSDGASGSYTITVRHERYAVQSADIVLLPGQSIEGLILVASSDTTLVECQVVEIGTDVPMAGACIQGWNRIGKFSGYSDSDGVFAFRVLPGLVQLSFHSPPDGVYMLDGRKPDESSLDFEARGRKMAVTLKTPPVAGMLRNVSGIVFGREGTAWMDSETIVYAGAGGRIITSIGSDPERPVWIDGDGRFELKGVPAGRKLRIYVATKDRTLAAADVFEIPDDPDWSDYLTINLVGTQSTSVVISDEKGDIVPDSEFRIYPMIEDENMWSVDIRGRTDENGLLELDGIIPGLEYDLRIVKPNISDETLLEESGETLTLKMVLVPLES